MQPQVLQILETPRMATVTVENLGCNKDDLLEKESGSEFAKRFWKVARPP